MSTPKNLNYNIVKPLGYPSTIKQEKFTPVSFNTANSGVSSQDVVRFNINSKGFWDPYSAYIKIEVDVSQMDGVKNQTGQNLSVGSLQLDNSAQSFINQLIIWRQGSELERIENYDILAALLNDIHGSNDNKSVRSFEGMSSLQMTQASQYQNSNRLAHIAGAVSNATTYQTGYNPLLCQNLNSVSSLADDYSLNVDNTTALINSYNRYEFTLCNEGKNTVQTTKPSQYTQNGYLQASANLLGQNPYNGYTQAFCPLLSAYGNEPILSKNIPQITTYKGKLGQYIFADRQTFCIPIISGLLGVLMPIESYRYIPMSVLQDLQLEFRLSPHALFTSGYADLSIGKTGNAVLPLNTATNPMLQRAYRITKFELNVEMQYFNDPIPDIILSKLSSAEGIILHTNSWQCGQTNPIPANVGPSGTYIMNLLYESLKTVLFCFIPDDYINYSYCRKQYRICHNITSLYLKVGGNYIPPLPISGHAGTAAGYTSLNNDYDANNSEFLVNLYKAFGKYNDIQGNSTINNVNFAVNGRAYDPTNTASLFNATSNSYTNLDTALSLPLFHENRCVGRSVYALDLETVNQDASVMSGLNTTAIGANPWEIAIKSDSTNAFPRASQMYTFCQFDLLIQLTKTASRVYGKN